LVNIDLSTCGHCGGAVRIVASIEEPTATKQDHTERPRSRREALGPLSATGGKSPRAALPNTHQPAQTRCDDAPITATPSQTDGCAASGYRVRGQKMAFEFPIPTVPPSCRRFA